jgi:hypothetical protein
MKMTNSNSVIAQAPMWLYSWVRISIIATLSLGLCISATGTTSVVVAWDATTHNTDGTPMSDLGGYRLHYGVSSGNYPSTVEAGSTLQIVLQNLA